MTLNLAHMKSVLAKNIDVKDTLDYALFGVKEPGLLGQFFLLGPIFSGLKTHLYFVGVTTSGLAFVEVNAKYEERRHRFHKYYEIDSIEEGKVLKGKRLRIKFKKGDMLDVVLPRVVLGLNNHEEDVESAIRVIVEKIKNSKEYFKKQRPRNNNSQRSSNNQRPNNNQRNKNYNASRRRKKRPANKSV